ncbi:MAG TPA: hypothetical protein VN231_07410 [Allosphingosinicella sp.]|nr:hypothetical protein [Allosphingosinicella sp.]
MASLRLSAAKTAVNDAAIGDQDKAAVIRALEDAAGPLPDTWVYRIVVIALGLALFVPLIGPLVAPAEEDVIQLLLPIATGALGALAGLLAPSPSGGA